MTTHLLEPHAAGQIDALTAAAPRDLTQALTLMQQQSWHEAEALLLQLLLEAGQRRTNAEQRAPLLAALGRVYQNTSRFDEAVAAYRQVLAWQPHDAMLINSLGWVQRKRTQWVEAMLAFRAAIALKPDLAAAHASLGMVLLQLGAFEEGWREYEYRLQDDPSLRVDLPFAEWQGEPVQGKRMLLLGEQGLGDVIQFARYGLLLARLGAQVDVLVQPPVVRLLQLMPGIHAAFHTLQTTSDAYDYQCNLMSLPLRFHTTLSTIPAPMPYVLVPPDLRAHWRERLARLSGLSATATLPTLDASPTTTTAPTTPTAPAAPTTPTSPRPWRIGLCWAGGQRPDDHGATELDRRRSLHLTQFTPLLELPGLEWHSLQLGAPAAQVTALPAPLRARLHRHEDALHDFLDTAALVEQLDLVISCDTSVAHLAGARNRPLWILNRFDLCWRWLLNRQDSPWYPSARLYHQPQPGDWQSVIQSTHNDLATLTSNPPAA